MSFMHRVRVVLKVNRNNTASVLTRAHAVNDGMSADPQRYLTPSPPLVLFGAQIVKLEQAEQRVATRVKGTAAARDVAPRPRVGRERRAARGAHPPRDRRADRLRVWVRRAGSRSARRRP